MGKTPHELDLGTELLQVERRFEKGQSQHQTSFRNVLGPTRLSEPYFQFCRGSALDPDSPSSFRMFAALRGSAVTDSIPNLPEHFGLYS